MISRTCIALRHRLHMQGEEGAAAVEYGLLVALIAAVIVLVVTSLGSHVSNAFSSATVGWP